MGAWPASARSSAEQDTGELTPVERLLDPEARLQHALDLAYRYLARRDRTVREVRAHLEVKRVEPATIDQAVATLHEVGYLDDARYAARFAEDRRALDGWGADRIERKLAALGVPAHHVASALAAQDAGAERAAALALLQRRYPSPLGSPRERERALGFLLRKGYPAELAYDVIRAHATV